MSGGGQKRGSIELAYLLLDASQLIGKLLKSVEIIQFRADKRSIVVRRRVSVP
jgi:hypothetical protein